MCYNRAAVKALPHEWRADLLAYCVDELVAKAVSPSLSEADVKRSLEKTRVIYQTDVGSPKSQVRLGFGWAGGSLLLTVWLARAHARAAKRRT